jgi:tetratricopeptide (TPR) repeat protein
VQANAAIDSRDTDQAKQLLDQATALSPKSADLVAARARLGQPEVSSGNDNDTTTATPSITLTPQQQVQVANMVQQAKVAANRGNIMSPPGDCAYDLYRGALAIDGNNPAALAGLQGLSGLVLRQFNQALSAGNLNKAGSLLDALDNLSPGDAGLVQSRQRLTDAWLDQAERQLDSGDRNNAAQSLEQGRKLTPNDQRVQQLTVRMQGGG